MSFLWLIHLSSFQSRFFFLLELLLLLTSYRMLVDIVSCTHTHTYINIKKYIYICITGQIHVLRFVCFLKVEHPILFKPIIMQLQSIQRSVYIFY